MNISIKHIILIIVFITLQIVWFNHLLLFKHFSPLVFLFPILLLPLHNQQSIIIFIAFIIGLFIDISLETGGVFAGTSVFIVYFRKIFFLFIKNKTQDIKSVSLQSLPILFRLLYYSIFIILAHLFVYFFESFSFQLVFYKISFLLINSMLTLFIFIFVDVLFLNNKKNN